MLRNKHCVNIYIEPTLKQCRNRQQQPAEVSLARVRRERIPHKG